MSVSLRGKTWTIAFRPFGNLVMVSLKGCEGKRQAMAIESELLDALRRKDYAGLTDSARQACIRLFLNQNWEMPDELQPRQISPPNKVITFWNAVELYSKDPSFRQLSARNRYASKFKHLVLFFRKNKPVKEIWVPEIKMYRTHRSSQGAKNATINREMAALSSIFRVLIEHQIVDINPCRSIKKLPEKDSEREVYVSHEDFKKIVNLLPDDYHDFLWILYLSGLRRGELYELQWKNVDLRSRIIHFHATETKEYSRKRVPIHKDLLPIFENVGKVRTLGDDRIWKMNYHSLSYHWAHAVKELGWTDPRPRINDLRHTFKTNCRRSKIDEELRESFMGHAGRKKNVSHRYGFIDDYELVNAIDQFTYDNGLTQIIAVPRAKK